MVGRVMSPAPDGYRRRLELSACISRDGDHHLATYRGAARGIAASAAAAIRGGEGNISAIYFQFNELPGDWHLAGSMHVGIACCELHCRRRTAQRHSFLRAD